MMPLYYFDAQVNDVPSLPDDEGVVLPDLNAARHEAIDALYALSRELDPVVSCRRVTLIIRDSAQKVLFESDLTLTVRQ